jgi:hypothetical protein
MIWRKVMKTRFTVALSLLAGAALGAAAVQGLHAQAKPKAFILTESEVLDAAALAAYKRRRLLIAPVASPRPPHGRPHLVAIRGLVAISRC